MSNGAFVPALNVHVVFALYMLLHGIPWQRIISVSAVSVAIAAVLAFVMPFYLHHITMFVPYAMSLSVLVLPFVVLYYARDELMPRVNAIELILLNVVAVMFMASVPGMRYLINPLSWLSLPPGLALLVHYVLSYWPSWISLYLIRKGEEPGKRVRLWLVVWATLVYAFLLFSPAVHALQEFDVSSLSSWLISLFTALVVVRVTLLVVSVVDLLTRKKDALDEGESGSEHGTHTAFLASRFILPRVSFASASLMTLAFWFIFPNVVRFGLTGLGIELVVLQSWSLIAVSTIALMFSRESESGWQKVSEE